MRRQEDTSIRYAMKEHGLDCLWVPSLFLWHGLHRYRSGDELFSKLRSMHTGDADWHNGRMFSLIYHAGAEAEGVARAAYTELKAENTLSPFSFPRLLKKENELMSLITSLFHGAAAVGSMTSGGSESILMAVRTAYDWARENRPAVAAQELLPRLQSATFSGVETTLRKRFRPFSTAAGGA